MRRWRVGGLRVALALGTAALVAVPGQAEAQVQAEAQAGHPASAPVAAALAQIAGASNGTVGVAMQDLDGGEVISLHGAQSFPMASTFKIALAATVLAKVDTGEWSLDRMIAVRPQDRVYSDGIFEFAPHDGVALSVHNLLELMLTRSDNTATDVLYREVGGSEAVMAWLGRHGIGDMRVDSDTRGLIFRALKVPPGDGDFVKTVLATDPHVLERDLSRTPSPDFDADPRDQATPRAMLHLLKVLAGGTALSPGSTGVLMTILGRCLTGEDRLKGLLPEGAPVAHKTGSLLGIANDVGYVTLPDGHRFAIVVFIKGDSRGAKAQDRVIAEIARTAYDHYRLNR
ncbi:class A beta-lactamase [Novosphingobium mangrovi (ex Hu et al. 2023)]|uniref:Beta-lactamase n=1 Tax=Novosphingobium mangrovi (ex Hu et al. 2023) TaxID=2930094 RepID=A0ABT0ACR1_9SPHN|nr:class A beta-lactamase [Novosphingobium mangrovi (ex Hu et al. 2023)]MCJ1960977.1 class A beta-lactamase [Novosphingobium mangrovi (ex Hu et al. 2023)]